MIFGSLRDPACVLKLPLIGLRGRRYFGTIPCNQYA